MEPAPAVRPHRPVAETDAGKAVLVFKVLPADCEVEVDGKRQRPHADGNQYRVPVAPGDHVVNLADRHSDAAKTVRVEQVRSGEVRTLIGMTLADDLP